MTPAVLAFGLPGTLLALIPLWLAAGLLDRASSAACARTRPRRWRGSNGRKPSLGHDEWGPFARLASVVGLRSAIFFGLQAFIPVYFAVELGTSEAAGNGALSVMLVAGAVGTYVGGRLVDRLGRRPIVVLSMGALAPLLVAFLLVGRWPATVLLVAIGFVVIANFSITVVMSQEYLPNRLGLASGITLGAAIGVGGLAAAALGALADHTSLTTTLWVIAADPDPGVPDRADAAADVGRPRTRALCAPFHSGREQRRRASRCSLGWPPRATPPARRSSPGCVGA